MATDKEPDPRKLRLMRQVATAGHRKYSMGGRVKEGGHALRKPSLPKTPWDDEQEEQGGRS